MRHADENDYESIKEIFNKHKEWFPHITNNYIRIMIDEDRVIFEKDVVIIYNNDGKECVLNQIVSKERNGSAYRITKRFFNFVKKDVSLTVRKDNEIAIKFYEKLGMRNIGEKKWSNGTEGYIFEYRRSEVNK